MANEGNLIPATKGEVRNPNGKPKGTKNLSTWIKELLNDEEFETYLIDGKKGLIEYKGAPTKALIKVAIHRALHDEKNGVKWAEWLAKYGYGMALKLSGDPDHPLEVTHVYKPEKLQQLIDINNQGHALQERAERAVEGQIDAMDSTAGAADVRPTDT